MKKLRTYLLGLRPFAFIILLLLINFSCKKEKIPTDICNNFTPYNGEDSLGYLIDEKVNQIEIATLKTAELLEHRKNTLPKSFDHGNMITSSSSAWTSGFFGGILWQLYENNPCPSFYKFAELYTRRVEREKSTKTHHDVGYIIYSSFGTALRIDNANNRKDIVLQAANSLLSRFSETVGLIRSWDWNQENWNYPVIIDNMMNLELLLWAYKQTNSAKYYDAAISHANKTMTHHYREDYSSYHLVDYNIENGTVRSKQTVQGFSKNSSWARGQAWGLYGFTMMYRETGLKKYLQHAEKIADFILKHPRLPSDKIPYWDFDDPRIPNKIGRAHV